MSLSDDVPDDVSDDVYPKTASCILNQISTLLIKLKIELINIESRSLYQGGLNVPFLSGVVVRFLSYEIEFLFNHDILWFQSTKFPYIGR